MIMSVYCGTAIAEVAGPQEVCSRVIWRSMKTKCIIEARDLIARKCNLDGVRTYARSSSIKPVK
jgi:hypothetical protein